jgi:two-component system, NtrC family, sensor histidine kinase HydH
MTDRRAVARWGLLGAAVAAALVLVGATGWSHLGILDRSDAVAQGHAGLLASAIGSSLQATGSIPEATDLESIVATLDDEGLRWIGVGVAGPSIEGGSRLDPTAPLPEPPAMVLDDGDRITALVVLPPRPGPAAGMPAAGGGGPPRDVALAAGRTPVQLPVHMYFEFVPTWTRELRHRSERTLAIATAAALLLVGAALLSYRAWTRADQVEAEAAETRHLTSLGQVSAVLAHEIRNPLAALKGHAQLLAEVLDEHPRVQQRALRVVGEAVRLEKLTNELLDFARTADLKRAEVDPASLARAIALDTAPERVRVDETASPDRWSLDSDRVRQVLLNLVRNALDADRDDAEVTLTVALRSGALVFEVRDRGPGVPDDDIEQLFTPFYTTRTRGTGLGLPVSRRLIALHGGTLTAANHPEGGAIFTACIPEEPHG